MRVVRSAYSEFRGDPERNREPFGDEHPTEGAKQSFKEECDINRIMRRFVKTGVVSHVNERRAQYGVATSQTYHEAMEVVRNATEMFAAVPAVIRKRFNNDAAAFLDFVNDDRNVEEMVRLGLAEKRAPRPKDPLEVLGDRIVEAVKGRPGSGSVVEEERRRRSSPDSTVVDS